MFDFDANSSKQTITNIVLVINIVKPKTLQYIYDLYHHCDGLSLLGSKSFPETILTYFPLEQAYLRSNTQIFVEENTLKHIFLYVGYFSCIKYTFNIAAYLSCVGHISLTALPPCAIDQYAVN